MLRAQRDSVKVQGPDLPILAWIAGASAIVGVLAAAFMPLMAAAALTVGAVVWAVTRPRSFTLVLLTILAVAPTFYRFKAPGIPILLDPGLVIVALGVAGLALSFRAGSAAPNWSLVVPVSLLAIGRSVSVVSVSTVGFTATMAVALQAILWPCLCLALGWLAVNRSGVDTVFTGLFAAAILASVIGVFELITDVNPWLDLGRQFVAEPQWLVRVARYGQVRVAGAFNHAIAFGLFNASVAAVAFGRLASRWSGRVLPAAALVGSLVGTVIAFSRGPWAALIAVAGCALAGRLLMSMHEKPMTFLLASVVLAGATVWWLSGGSQQILSMAGFAGGSVDAGNVAYRVRLLQSAADVSQNSLLFGSGTQSSTGAFLSVDNGFLHEFFSYGLVGLVSWTVASATPIMIAVRRVLLRRRGSSDIALSAAALTVYLIGYATVASFGVGSGYFWILAGTAWALVQRPSHGLEGGAV